VPSFCKMEWSSPAHYVGYLALSVWFSPEDYVR
jgi:hypothetical protein